MARLQGSPHHTNVTSAVESVVATAVRHLNQLLLDGLAAQLGRVDKVRGAELAGPRLLAVVDIDHDDAASLVLDRTLDDRETDTAGTEDGNVGALLHLGGDNGRTVTGGDTAAKQAGTVRGDLGGHGDNRDVGHDGVLGEGGGAHEVQQVLAAGLETGGAVGHHTLALGGTNLTAEVGLAGLAELALTALGGAGNVSNRSLRLQKIFLLESNDIVTGLHGGNALADGLDDTGTLVTQNNGESTFGVLSGESVGIWLGQPCSIPLFQITNLCGRHQCGGPGCGPRGPWEEQLRRPQRREALRRPRRRQPTNWLAYCIVEVTVRVLLTLQVMV